MCLPRHYDDGGFTGGNMDGHCSITEFDTRKHHAASASLRIASGPNSGRFDHGQDTCLKRAR
jgi:hypothetical protein